LVAGLRAWPDRTVSQDLRRTTETDGVFYCTFLTGVATKQQRG
jgi:hypothetical protein